jgi:hypothetical protein
MKNILLLTLFIGSFSTINAQFGANHAIYYSGELGYGSHLGIDVNLNYVYHEKYAVKIGYSGNVTKPTSLPSDYSLGLTRAFSFGFEYPYDQLENVQITVGRIYKLNPKGTIRFNLSAGLGYSIITEPENWERITDNNVILSENYTWNYRKHNTVSLIINPKIEFPIARHFGFTLSPMLQINKDTTYIGIGVGTMFGLLRKKN